jgi:hypothetical protein
MKPTALHFRVFWASIQFYDLRRQLTRKDVIADTLQLKLIGNQLVSVVWSRPM